MGRGGKFAPPLVLYKKGMGATFIHPNCSLFIDNTLSSFSFLRQAPIVWSLYQDGGFLPHTHVIVLLEWGPESIFFCRSYSPEPGGTSHTLMRVRLRCV